MADPTPDDELDVRIRSLEAERLRVVPKLFTSRAHDDPYNALLRRAKGPKLSTSASTCDPQGKPLSLRASDEESAEIERRRQALLEALAGDPEEED